MQRFYAAGDPSTWLSMPQWLLDVFINAQPRLEAEESMLMVSTLLAGTGHLSDKDYQKRLNDWEQQSSGLRPGALGRRRSLAAFQAFAAGVGEGFKVIVEEVPAP